MALLLSCESLTKSYGPRTLFTGISFGLDDQERTGLIGPNGSGKSTLLKLLAGAEAPDEGEINTRRNLRLEHVEQQDVFPANVSVEQVLVDAMASMPIDEHDRVARASILLGKIGFTDPDQSAHSLSGGWKKRLAIARALVREPDLLLLDEPTNHLDLEGILWLERLLKTSSFACLIVSHDRYFLENVANRVIELNRAYPEGYLSVNGSYSDFLEKREGFMVAQQAQQTALASRVRREIEWLKRGAKARTTKAKGRIESAGRMMTDLAELKVRNAQDKAVSIDFTASDRKTRKLLAATGVTKSYGGRVLFRDVDVVLSPKMKLGLLGPNGSGKTTLLRILAGELEPDAGRIKRADNLRVVRFEQDRSRLDRRATLRDALSPKSDTVVYQAATMHISAWARRFLFGLEQLDMPVGELSGGEQARVLIAQLMLEPADLLILDEPTNDLDIPTLEVLEESLEEFPGALVLVTHDRYMLDNLSTDLLGLDGKGGASLYADYPQWEQAQSTAKETAAAAVRSAAVAKAPSKPAASGGGKRLSYMEQREWEQIERKIMEAEEAVEAAQRETSDPKVMANRDKMHDACERLGAAEQLVRTLYARWEELDAKQR
jgi:ABC transport system ATP-binding/permease protein